MQGTCKVLQPRGPFERMIALPPPGAQIILLSCTAVTEHLDIWVAPYGGFAVTSYQWPRPHAHPAQKHELIHTQAHIYTLFTEGD